MSYAWIDLKYINIVSTRLDRFSWVRQNKVARVRCPICGDSHTDKTKARGYFLVSSDVSVYYCQNCNANMSLKRFLELNFRPEFEDYIMELYQESGSQFVKEPTKRPSSDDVDLSLFSDTPKFAPKDFLKTNAVRVGDLPYDHIAPSYIRSRRIKYEDLWYTDDFKSLVEKFDPSYERMPTEPRLIIPYRNYDGSIIGFQGRSFDKNTRLRYLTVKKDPESDIIFGLDRVNFDKTVFVLEGALDATFLPNSLAVNGSSLGRLGNTFTKNQLDKCVFVFDNEPRNTYIVRNMHKLLETGHRVVVWGDTPGKDINQMILNGWTMRDVAEAIRDGICTGVSGLMKLNMWKRC